MNYMDKIAELLGVEIGEEFNLKGHSSDEKYRLTRESLEYFYNDKWYTISGTLNYLLNGEYEVVKLPKPILTKEEKEYLSMVIKPFRDEIRYIHKFTCFNGTKEYLLGSMKDIGYHLELPPFVRGTMYCGMERCREYTLEELDL